MKAILKTYNAQEQPVQYVDDAINAVKNLYSWNFDRLTRMMGDAFYYIELDINLLPLNK